MTRRLLPVVLVVALTAACTSGAGEPVRQAAAGTEPGGTLRVGITAPGSVDPGNDYEPMGDLVLQALCDPLIAVDPLTGELQPALLQSWLVSDDGQRLTLRVRQDVRFSDGTELTADDVAFTLSRVASAEYASLAAALLEPIDGFAQVSGAAEAKDDRDRRRLKGVRVLDRDTVEISLVRRQADFLRVLTHRVLSPVPRAAVERDPVGFPRQPVCSGPYRLEQPFEPGGTSLRLVRWDGYSAPVTALTGGGRSYPDAIEFTVFPSSDDAAAAAAAGAVDVAPARAADDVGVHAVPGPDVEYAGLPAGGSGAFADPVVRRALALALDREALVRRVFPGTRVPATGFLPPTTRPLFREQACDTLPPRGDVPRARALLAEAGVDLTQVSAPFHVDDGLRNPEVVAEVARQWQEALGLVLTPQPQPYEDYLAAATSAQGLPGPFRFSWGTRYPDPDGYLHPLFASDRIGRDNWSRFSSGDLDELLVRRARQATDEQDRRLDQQRAEDLLCQQMPMVPLTFRLSRWVVSDRVGSAVDRYVDVATGQPLLREMYLRGGGAL